MKHGLIEFCVQSVFHPWLRIRRNCSNSNISFDTIGSPLINNDGRVAFTSSLLGANPIASDDVGIFKESVDGQIELVIRYGDNLSGLNGNESFGGGLAVDLNDLGQVVVSGSVAGPDISSRNMWGIWSGKFSDDFHMVARQGDPAPGNQDGSVFLHFDAGIPKLNNQGRVAFMAYAGPAPEPGQPLSGGFYGLWVASSSGELQLVLRPGDLLDVSDDPALPDLREVDRLFLRGNEDIIDENGVSTAGQLLLSVTFTDGTSGIFLSDLAPITIPGDYDGNRQISGDDLLAWQRGESPNPYSAADLAMWQQVYESLQNASAAASQVPEPGAMALLWLTSLAWFVSARSRRRPPRLPPAPAV